MIDFDYILSKINPLGPYQLFLVILVYWLAIPSQMHNVASVFIAAKENFRFTFVLNFFKLKMLHKEVLDFLLYIVFLKCSIFNFHLNKSLQRFKVFSRV